MSGEDDLTTLEWHCLLRSIRATKDGLEESWNGLSSRKDAHGDGHTDAALLALENELYVVNNTLRKVWLRYTIELQKSVEAETSTTPRRKK